jgi:hypothetical protein
MFWSIFLLMVGIISIYLIDHLNFDRITHPIWLLFTVLGIILQQISQSRFQSYCENRLMNLPSYPEVAFREFAQALPKIQEWQELEGLLKKVCDEYQIGKSKITFDSQYHSDRIHILDEGIEKSTPVMFSFELGGLIAQFGERYPNYYPPMMQQFLIAMLSQVYLFAQNKARAEALQNAYIEQARLQSFDRERVGYEMHHLVLNPLNTLRSKTPDLIMQNLLNDIDRVIRGFIRRARLPELKDGLWNSLENLALEFCYDDFGRSAIPVFLDVPKSNMRYSNEVEQMLYLICREACENARKHAQTSAVTIDGWFTADEVELVVSDSGKGFDPKYFEDSERFGLKAQNAFALAIGAQILYRGREEGGTEVVIRWSSGKRVENS